MGEHEGCFQQRAWCVVCARDAVSSCKDAAHATRESRGRERRDTPWLPFWSQVAKDREESHSLIQHLDDCVTAEREDLHQRNLRFASRMVDLHNDMQWAGTKEDGELALDQVHELVLHEADALKMLRAQGPVSISLGGWRAEGVNLQENPTLHLALLHLQRKGLLQPEGNGREGQKVEDRPRQLSVNGNAQEIVSVEEGGLQSVYDVLEAEADGVLLQIDLRQEDCTTQEKSELLRLQVVHVIKGLGCLVDPTWSLELLKRHADTLVEVEVVHAGREHLLALQRMPQLRCLHVHDKDILLDRLEPSKDLHCVGALHILRVSDVPDSVMLPLLQWYAPTLEELDVTISTTEALSLLERMPRLRRLTLRSTVAFKWSPKLCDFQGGLWCRWQTPGLSWLRTVKLPNQLVACLAWVNRFSVAELEMVCNCCPSPHYIKKGEPSDFADDQHPALENLPGHDSTETVCDPLPTNSKAPGL